MHLYGGSAAAALLAYGHFLHTSSRVYATDRGRWKETLNKTASGARYSSAPAADAKRRDLQGARARNHHGKKPGHGPSSAQVFASDCDNYKGVRVVGDRVFGKMRVSGLWGLVAVMALCAALAHGGGLRETRDLAKTPSKQHANGR
jgi:hypothetical protein